MCGSRRSIFVAGAVVVCACLISARAWCDDAPPAPAANAAQTPVVDAAPAPQNAATPPKDEASSTGKTDTSREEPAHPFGPRKKGLPTGLDAGTSVNPAQALTPPDWNQPFRDIEADVWETQLGAEKLSLKGNVHLNLDNMRFSADEFSFDQASNEMHAKGHVLIVQDLSKIIAEEIDYRVAPETEAPKALVLEPSLSEQQRAKRRLSFGYIDACGVTVSQPGTELSADTMHYNLVDSTGDLVNAKGHADIYYFGGAKLRILGPASLDGEDVWVTTCDRDPPHYRVRLKAAAIRNGEAVYGEGARLYIGEVETPLYWPRWGYRPGETGAPLSFDFDSGHRARIGYYVDSGMQFSVTPDAKLGLRLFPTTQAGVGFGIDSEYNFMQNPASPLFLSQGTLHSLYTTDDRGYLELRHRQEIADNTVLLLQVEQWSDADFYKDFYWDHYRNRTEPRTFANVTYTQPGYIATGTVRAETNGFVTETEQLPEGTYHLLQRELAKNLYVSFDTINGYLENEPNGEYAARSVNVGRFTYDVNLCRGLNLMPFVELEGTMYSQDLDGRDGATRLSSTFGLNLQSRLSKTYDGAFGFSGFKHIIVPSITYSYRPDSTMSPSETPLFDGYDTMNGRSRIESKIDNVVFGRDAKTNRSWQLGRLSLYQGNDLENEVRKMEDYEGELQLQPRPWWGVMVSAEHHRIDDDVNGVDAAARQSLLQEAYASLFLDPDRDPRAYEYLSQYGDYNNVMTFFYYDDTYFNGKYNAKLGFSYTETGSTTYNREVMYGLGYRLGENWGLAFEQRYDFERNELSMQKYQVRRKLHCWEAALTFRDRQSGWDFGIEFNVSAFPGSRLKF